MGLSCLRLPVFENQVPSNHVVDMFIFYMMFVRFWLFIVNMV